MNRESMLYKKRKEAITLLRKRGFNWEEVEDILEPFVQSSPTCAIELYHSIYEVIKEEKAQYNK